MFDAEKLPEVQVSKNYCLTLRTSVLVFRQDVYRNTSAKKLCYTETGHLHISIIQNITLKDKIIIIFKALIKEFILIKGHYVTLNIKLLSIGPLCLIKLLHNT